MSALQTTAPIWCLRWRPLSPIWLSRWRRRTKRDDRRASPNGDAEAPAAGIAIEWKEPNMNLKTLSFTLLGALATVGASHACTTILLGAPGHTRLAFSYDFVMEAGAVLINGRGAERSSIFAPEPAIWDVEHASVTFNQFGPGLPTTGMNDAGLVVTLMWNEDVDYPAPIGE